MLTPVLVTAADFTSAYAPTRLSYARGDKLNQLAPPAIEQPYSGGLIIQIPAEEPALYLERVLSLQSLQTDSVLLSKLDHLLRSSRYKPMVPSLI